MNERPTDRLVIAVAQLNPTVGDISGNLDRARKARAEAARHGADLVAFSELFIAGYPPEDLVLKPAFQAACRSAIEALSRDTADNGPAVLIGSPWVEGDKLYNAYTLLAHGRIEAMRFKVNLPNYGVFDEKRVFAAGPMPGPVNYRGVRIGLPICEDTWTEWGDYENVVECLAETGAELISLQLPAFQEAVVMTQWSRTPGGWRAAQGLIAPPDDQDQADYTACVLGLRDYVEKNRFKGVVIGLSGGVDSALCAAMAADALGRERVRCLMLPFRYTSRQSLDDAAAIAHALGVRYDVVPIESAVHGLEAAVTEIFTGSPRDVTEENLQARARGTILMAVSNKFNLMVVTTGNKSEMSVGYATLYGDMNGGFNPIKDLYKTEVYRLARLRNGWKPAGADGPAGKVIPENVLTRAPSAELRENQTDQDTLPPYEVLDQILERLVENEESTAAIVAAGFDRETVMKVERMLYLAEYKRRQAAPGVKVTLKNFGRDRRYPIVNRFHDPGTPLAERERTTSKAAASSNAMAKAGASDF
jgi:NAD+ synthase